jgi:hypothetical protein
MGTVDHHSDLPSGAAQPYWYRHDLGFVIDHALYWGCSYTEERVELTRAETDFALVDAHLDPFDQGTKNSTRACYGQLGPALSDLLGSRGKPPLRGSALGGGSALSAGVRAGPSGPVGRDAQDAATSGLRAIISLSGHIPVPHRR